MKRDSGDDGKMVETIGLGERVHRVEILNRLTSGTFAEIVDDRDDDDNAAPGIEDPPYRAIIGPSDVPYLRRAASRQDDEALAGIPRTERPLDRR